MTCIKTPAKTVLGPIFFQEFGRHYEQFSITEFGDEATVIVTAVGDKTNWVVQFWSEFQMNEFYGIWNRMPTMEDVLKFYEYNLKEGIAVLKPDRVVSEHEEWLVPEDISEWDAFFAPYKQHRLHFPDFFQDEETAIGAYIRNQDEKMINMILPEGVTVDYLSTSPNGNPELKILVPDGMMEETCKLFLPKHWVCKHTTTFRDVVIETNDADHSYKIIPLE